MALGLPAYDKTTQSFSDGQAVDSSISKADDKKLVQIVDRCVRESELHRNHYAIMTGSYLQDAHKCKELYDGVLYTRRKKKPHECKADLYAYYVDFNAQLMEQFDWKDYVRWITEEDGQEMNAEHALDAKSMTMLLKYCLDKASYKEKEEDMLRFAGIFGNGIYKFQPYEDSGQCWPGIEVIDTRFIGVSPGASSFQDAVYSYFRRPVPTSELKTSYPDKAKDILPDKEVTFDAEKTTSFNDLNVSMGLGASWANVVGSAMRDIITGGEKTFEQTNLTELYYKDPEIIKITTGEELTAWIESNPGFGSEYTKSNIKDEYLKKMQAGPIDVKKYPFGRVLVTASNVLLDDYPNPYPFIPFDNTKCYRRPKEFWAKGIIHKIREPIQNLHLVTSGLAANIDNRLRPSYYMSGATGAEVQKLKRVPTDSNTLVDLGPGNGKIDAIPVPNIAPPDVTAVAEMRRRDAEMTAGLEGVLAGVNQTGTYSGIQFEKQLEQAMGKVAPRYREVTRTRESVGEKFIWYIQNYLTDNRKIDMLDENEKQILMEINRQKAENASIETFADVTKGKYKFHIEAGINRPTTKQERASNVQAAAEIVGQVDPYLAAKMQLISMDIPGKWEWIREFEQSVEKARTNKEQGEQLEQKMKVAMQQKQAEMQEREMRNKEMQTESAGTKQVADIVQGFAKVGYPMPEEIVRQVIMAGQFDLDEIRKGAAV